jgi:hypothetical protein
MKYDGSRFFLCANFIMRKMVIKNTPNTRLIPWMASSLVVLLHQMLFKSTTHATNYTTSQTTTESTLIICQAPFIATLNMAGDRSVINCGTTIRPWRRNTPRELGLNKSIVPQKGF